MGKKHLTQQQRQQVIDLYCSGVTIEALSAQFDRDRRNIDAIIPADKRRGHKFRPKGKRAYSNKPMHDYNREQRADRRIGRPPQTHCKRGHEFTPANTRWHHNGKECRRCTNDNAKIRYNADPALRARILIKSKRIRIARKISCSDITSSSTS